MRIVGGRLGGRRLIGPGRSPFRPTSDRLRETLFDVLDDLIAGAAMLDAFAGSGAVGLEALSRGARALTSVESDRGSLTVLEANVEALGLTPDVRIVRRAFDEVAARIIERSTGARPFSISFLDPPYDWAALATPLDLAARLTQPGGLVILEHARRRQAPEHAAGAARFRLLEAGDSALSFYTAV